MAQPNSLADDFLADHDSLTDTVDAGRDPRLSWFACDGRYDQARPDAGMAAALEAVTAAGALGRPPEAASDDEVTGMLGCWQALEARAHARMLAAMREIIRRRSAADGIAARYPGELPARWDIGVAHEVAAQARLSWQAAAGLVRLAWELEARLPGTGALLDDGVLTSLKVKIISDEFSVLDDEKIAEAEKRLLSQDLAGDEMTPGRLRKICQRIADTVDPDGARQRREDAARRKARVAFFRAHGGDTGMFAEGLPPDEALKCQANIQARALDYKRVMVYPEAGMDFLRVLALVDLINGLTLDQRITRYHAEHAAAEDARNAAQRADDEQAAERFDRYRERLAKHKPAPPGPGTSDGSRGGGNGDGSRGGGNGAPDPGSRGPEPGWPGDEDYPGDTRYGDDPDRPAPPLPDEEPEDLDDCCFWPGFGPDPEGAPERRSPFGPDNGAGQATSSRGGRASHGTAEGDEGGPAVDGDDGGPGNGGPGGSNSPPGGAGSGGAAGSGGIGNGEPDSGLPALTHLTLPLATLLHLADRPGEAPGYGSIDPALVRDLAAAATQSPHSRFCLTITDEHGHAAGHGCARLIRGTGARGPGSRDGPPGSGWRLTSDHSRPGPDGGYGAWILTVPGGRRYRLDLHPVPVHDCDHRYATGSYRPAAMLRHLVEVRDGECTFTGCSHPAARCDFEHATPFDKGGVTDACNAGARSRRCHQVKQSRGWSVTQPKPGWHRWKTPSGRAYTKGPMSYPA